MPDVTVAAGLVERPAGVAPLRSRPRRLALAAVSGGFSISGMTAVFVGAFWPVIAMGAALELGKLSAVAWLGLGLGSRSLRVTLGVLVAVLMALNPSGPTASSPRRISAIRSMATLLLPAGRHRGAHRRTGGRGR